MTNAPDSLDWSSLGEQPLPDEMADDALLQAVLHHSDTVPLVVPAAAAPPRWIRPAVLAAVLLAAAVVLGLFAPSWSEALLGFDEQGALAPNVEAPREGDEAVRKPANSKVSTPPKVLTHERAVEPLEESPAEDELEPYVAAPAVAPRRRAMPAPSADELLRTAQDALAAKDTTGAIRKYSTLVRRHPRSAEARTARVSLGRLQLSAGQPNKALAQFDRYLEGSGGGLRREAELGRIDTLRKLGLADTEKRAIAAFLKAHPNTVHATRLRTQLEALP